jgi:hypothetical protein
MENRRMAKRSRTASGRILGLCLSAGCSAFVLWVILHYIGTGASTVSSWAARFIMADVAAAATAGFVLLFRSLWRYAVTRPLPSGRANAWLVRQPWWIVALIYWAALDVPYLAMVLRASLTHHRPPGAGLAGWALANGIFSAFMALMLRVLWRRQAENTAATAGE